MHPYQVIFLDLDHTLVDTRRQYDLGLSQAIQALYQGDVPSDFIQRFHYHHALLWEQYDKRQIDTQYLRRQRFIRAWKDFGVTRSDVEADEFHAAYNATFEQTLFTYPGTLEMLKEMAKSHTLSIVTNGTPDLQWRKMTIAGLTDLIPESAVIISERIGMAKPHPSVYQAACDALHVEAKNALMIGDNYRADYLGAKKFGMDAIWYVPDPDMNGAEGEDVALRRPEQVLEQIGQMEQARMV